VVKVNLADANSSIPVMPQGIYACRLASVEYKSASKSSGQPYYLLTFTVDEELNDSYGGQKLFRNLSVQPQALWAMKLALKALGADEEELESDEADLDDIFAGLIGALVNIKVGIRPYNGQDRNEVQAIQPFETAF